MLLTLVFAAMCSIAQQTQTPPPPPPPTVEEEVIVTATRGKKRVQDEPLRVEVLGREEVEEKMLMTPGDIAMLLSETTGLRVQVTSPGLGAASLRIQGLRGRYTLLLSDGLPLYGGQSGSLSLLQIPPMDLQSVELFKGAASSMFGPSALGGVVNLVSRRPAETHSPELLINQTSQRGTDAVLWLSGPIKPQWGYTLLTNTDRQSKRDVDDDGWADIAGFTRVSIRPRVTWSNGQGGNLFLTVGVMVEDREGGTMPGRTVPDGTAFTEALETKRFDAGLVAQRTWRGGILSFRGSATRQSHEQTIGDVREHDRHQTGFAESSWMTARGKHTWIVGGSVQADAFRATEQSRFNYTFWTPSVFVDHSLTLGRAGFGTSVRLDRHSEYGTIVSPRLAALFRPAPEWSIRLTGGTGFFAPTPLTEETEAAGLTRLRAFPPQKAERAQSYSADLNRVFARVDLNLTAFGSRVTGTLAKRQTAGVANQYELVALDEATNTFGGEALAKIHFGELTVVTSYTLVHQTEPDPVTMVRRAAMLTPRHSAGLTAVWEREDVGRAGIEVYFTGKQPLDENPYRSTSAAYPYFGALAEKRIGKSRLFVNFENLSNLRQTNYDPLVRPSRNFDGRWTVDAWSPLDGFVVNGGIRIAW
jgi:outer membrane receptor for ferrienterochelin and colicins